MRLLISIKNQITVVKVRQNQQHNKIYGNLKLKTCLTNLKKVLKL
jgi:hypothetical protein